MRPTGKCSGEVTSVVDKTKLEISKQLRKEAKHQFLAEGSNNQPLYPRCGEQLEMHGSKKPSSISTSCGRFIGHQSYGRHKYEKWKISRSERRCVLYGTLERTGSFVALQTPHSSRIIQVGCIEAFHCDDSRCDGGT